MTLVSLLNYDPTKFENSGVKLSWEGQCHVGKTSKIPAVWTFRRSLVVLDHNRADRCSDFVVADA
jgi:hypothetical protein